MQFGGPGRVLAPKALASRKGGSSPDGRAGGLGAWTRHGMEGAGAVTRNFV